MAHVATAKNQPFDAADRGYLTPSSDALCVCPRGARQALEPVAAKTVWTIFRRKDRGHDIAITTGDSGSCGSGFRMAGGH